MRREDFGKRAPGSLIRISGHRGDYWAFDPTPLPPEIRFDTPLVYGLSEADHALGELDGAGGMLPNPHLLIGPFLRREAVESSRIEGTITDLRQLVLFEADPEAAGHDGAPLPDREEVSNYVVALQRGLKMMGTLPISRRLLKEIHGTLMAGVRGQNKRPGEFRDRQNAIGRYDGQPASEARFIPPPVPEMERAFDALERYINTSSGLPGLIDLALIHYQFETIHPFLDGNGRLGRLLISLLLQDRGLLSRPLLYLSAYFEKHNDAYKDHLLKVSRTGAWEDWLRFFLRGVAVQAREAVGRCRALLDLREGYRERLACAGQPANLLRLVDLLFERLAISARGATGALDISFTSAQRNIERLMTAGILIEATGRQRDRVYVAPEILRIVQGDDAEDSE